MHSRNRKDKVESASGGALSSQLASYNSLVAAREFAFAERSISWDRKFRIFRPALCDIFLFPQRVLREKVLDIPSHRETRCQRPGQTRSSALRCGRRRPPFSSLSDGKYRPRGASRRHKANGVPLVLTSRKSFRVASGKANEIHTRFALPPAGTRLVGIRVARSRGGKKRDSMIYLVARIPDGPP